MRLHPGTCMPSWQMRRAIHTCTAARTTHTPCNTRRAHATQERQREPPVAGGQQAADVITTVKENQLKREGQPPLSKEFKEMMQVHFRTKSQRQQKAKARQQWPWCRDLPRACSAPSVWPLSARLELCENRSPQAVLGAGAYPRNDGRHRYRIPLDSRDLGRRHHRPSGHTRRARHGHFSRAQQRPRTRPWLWCVPYVRRRGLGSVSPVDGPISGVALPSAWDEGSLTVRNLKTVQELIESGCLYSTAVRG